MIANITSGKNFYGVANYNQQKIKAGKGELLDKQKIVKTSPNAIQKTFDSFRTSRVSKPVFHVSLSFSEQDKSKLSNEKLREISKEYLDKMGYGDQPYVLYKHTDTKHPHVHILTSRVDIASGKKLPHSHEQRKSKRITDELEVKHGLTISDKQVAAKQSMVGDLQKVLKNSRPENLKMLNKELAKQGSSIRVRSTGKGLVYYQVGKEGAKRKSPSVKSSLFKDVGLDKKSLENTFSKHQNNRQYVKGKVEKVLAKSGKINATTYARKLKEVGIEAKFRFKDNRVIGVNYGYKDHTYKGSSLDRSLSFNKVKERLEFTDSKTLELRQNLLENMESGQAIEMEYDNKKVTFSTANPTLDKQLKELPQKEAIDLSRQVNDYQSQYEKADIDGKKLIKGMAEDNLDEYLQRRYKQQQRANERRIKR